MLKKNCITNLGKMYLQLSKHKLSFFDHCIYQNLPNKGAGHSSKVKSDGLGVKLRFSAFQRWFRIENQTIIKENRFTLAIYDSIGFLQTRGRPY